MINIETKEGKQQLLGALIALGGLTVLVQLLLQRDSFFFDDATATENSNLIANLRLESTENCNLDWWSVPQTQKRLKTSQTLQSCPMVFIDYGANIGDSLGKFIDATLPPSDACHGKYNVTTGIFDTLSQPSNNKLTSWVAANMNEASHQIGKTLHPESYCYVGVEGNPVFTKQLEQLQHRVMHSYPRPVRNVQILTETIGVGVDGPAVLYLDTVNKEQNYWGSSVFDTHPDVVQSETKNKKTSAKVQGMTLTTLLKQTTQHHYGNHVLIKLDVEGAEYELLNEAYDSGILCAYATSAVRVDVLVELHPKPMLGDNGRAGFERFDKETKRGLTQCGIHLSTGKNAGRMLLEETGDHDDEEE